MGYRCVAASATGFVQQLAAVYLPSGYWFYVLDSVPERQDPRRTDRTLIEKYGIGTSSRARTRPSGS